MLDPFAGVGGVHNLDPHGDPQRAGFGADNDWIDTIGLELEPEWAHQHPWTMVGDATALPFRDCTFDVVVTSPTYGNRMADHHNGRDGSKRITYTHTLGRPLTPGNSGAMHWGEGYRTLHSQVWKQVDRVLRPGAFLVLNVSNHIRKGNEIGVSEWHRDTLMKMGFTVTDEVEVQTPRMGFGANRETRVGFEHVISFRHRTG